ncbi:tRNA (adenosine(37)-N6)-threonylcarbamoyltransferase complex transferase subunit TsaD [Patescibacteria group bacterium]|nr:tRNA (adenosine(37)-N6)-threonylcarbamoyltransferase complex transferase subunit TsaD [Patescibacteria group bacterium]
MKILSIETSCDETSLAVVEAKGGRTPFDLPQFRIEKSLVASQINIHRPFGGVVPNLAKREHLKNLPILYNQIFGTGNKEKTLWDKIDLIAVTVGPGLEPALWSGIEFAKELAKRNNKPLAGANHLEGHLYSFLLKRAAGNKLKASESFPAIALIVSGGHTILLQMDNLYRWRKIGETRDDAVGEAYDKVARLLGLEYPGGPEIEKLARLGNPKVIDFPRPMIYHRNYDFSFSGLKTSVRYYLATHPGIEKKPGAKADIAASFQAAAFDVLSHKTGRAIYASGAKSLLVSGGVSINKALRRRFQKDFGREVKVYFPHRELCNDNAAMIAAASYIRFVQGKKYRPVAQANLNM